MLRGEFDVDNHTLSDQRLSKESHQLGFRVPTFLTGILTRYTDKAGELVATNQRKMSIDRHSLCSSTPPEQEAIAEALSDADALIESLEQLIAKKRQIKQGAMQELLTGKKRLPGFIGNGGKED